MSRRPARLPGLVRQRLVLGAIRPLDGTARALPVAARPPANRPDRGARSPHGVMTLTFPRMKKVDSAIAEFVDL